MKLNKVYRIPQRFAIWLCLSAILLNCFSSIGVAQKSQAHPKRAVASSQAPLSFEANYGQAEPLTDFLVRGRNFIVSLSAAQAQISVGSENLGLQFVGANREAEAIGEQPLTEKTNYLIGKNPKDFRTNIPHYARTRFKQVYSGVDVLYYGDQGRLKYDIVIAPGTDPNTIKIKYSGVKDIKIDRSGNLVLNMTGGSVVQPKPIVYQPVKDKRRYVTGNYLIQNNNEIAFRIGDYDKSKELVIDPVLVFATYLGGSGVDEGMGVATDSQGNAYIVGTTTSLNFPTTAGTFQPAKNADKDVFVTKVNPNGNSVIYSTYIGGSLDDSGYGIAIDSEGNAYITGATVSANYPTTPGVLQTSNGGNTDAFVTKLNKTGSALVYSSYLGGTGSEEGFGIALDFSGNATVTGVTASNNFTVTSSAVQSSLAGPTDAFVTRFNATGTGTLFSTYLGGSGADIGFGLGLDLSNDSVIATGVTDSMDFPTTVGAFRTVSAGSSDAFVVKLDKAGAVNYVTLLGGSGIDVGLSVAVDHNGNAYVNGLTDSSNFPTTLGSMQQANGGGESDAFVTKLGPTGAAPVFSTYVGGSGTDSAASIALGFGGKAILSGTTTSNNFPLTVDANQSVLNGGKDAFLSRLRQDGSGALYSSFVGGEQGEEAFGVAMDAGANSYVVGTTSSSNFPTTTGAFQTAGAGGADGFIVKVGPGPDSTLHLLFETSGPVVDQAAGLDSLLSLRDPLPFVQSNRFIFSSDLRTRVVIFVANLQLAPGETASSVIVNLIDSNNQSHDIVAEMVQQLPHLHLVQVVFKLPDGLNAGPCQIKVRAQGQTSNVGTIRITNP